MMQFKVGNSNSSCGTGEMADAEDSEVSQIKEDEKDNQELSGTPDRCGDEMSNSYRGDAQDSEGNVKSGYGNTAVAVSETSEFSPETLSHNNTPCKKEIMAHVHAADGIDLTSAEECKFLESSRDREYNKENCDVPVISALAVADTSVAPGTEDRSSPELVASLKNSANAVAPRAAWTPARRGDQEGAPKGREDGRVAVVFPGSVTQDSCCKFACEILKCVLYQRQQLPMTYDQLVFFQRKQQAASRSEEVVGWRPVKTSGWDGRKCQRTLQDLEEVLQQLEVLFSLSLVPRVLLLLGGTTVLPQEVYEVNMEALAPGPGERSLRTSACLRQLFRALFVADILSDARPVRLMATAVVALAHRDCGALVPAQAGLPRAHASQEARHHPVLRPLPLRRPPGPAGGLGRLHLVPGPRDYQRFLQMTRPAELKEPSGAVLKGR
ncbi:hypothetical protein AAFF_G00198470 [Aldrovandia affinis]|uniref:MAD2L1-binding protein n=1 Tax=Aldrovandia affinis TaxID=143900 RepID=A0AAD7W593_9TELE|nr:hypothetical protein AAFF_G00198470 [Aldrovandia affinis]